MILDLPPPDPSFAYASAGFAILGSLLLTATTTLLGPDVRVLRCMDWRGRTLAYVVAGWWFFRGIVLISRPEAQSWAAPVSWALTTTLVGYGLVAIWGERMPPEVRWRFDRRQTWKRDHLKGLVAEGRTAEAELEAEGTSLGVQQAYELGLEPDTTRRLQRLP